MFFIKKTLSESSAKSDTDEEDTNEESTETEEDYLEEESILSELTSLVLPIHHLPNHAFDQSNLLYDCLYVNQILTPPKLNV
jgi:hypothetical protein